MAGDDGQDERIKKGCPSCGAGIGEIEYRNCGPIVFIRCTVCCFRLIEGVDTPPGTEALFERWNCHEIVEK